MNDTTDGIQYVSTYQFEQMFQNIYIAKYDQMHNNTVHQFQSVSNNLQYLKLNLTKGGHIFLGTQTYSELMYPKNCQNQSITGSFNIHSQNGSLIKTQSVWGNAYSSVEFHYLAAGMYYITAQYEFGPYNIDDFVIRAYSAKPLSFSIPTPEEVTLF